ncbi:MAG: MBL fold metallo-hydrolase [Solirubrobacteraceae bacterium]|nr:MBL fold metallo-hydrolase [Solirubrobacteraceae bacterium]
MAAFKMQPREIAPDVQLLPLSPRDTINAYVIGDVLIDAGTRHDAKKIKRMIGDQELSAHALTHVHPDHQGASAAVCSEYGIPLWAPAGEADEMEAGKIPGAASSVPARFMRAVAAGPGYPVSRRLQAGDEVGGFAVVASPGHSPDHVSYWRESDRVLIAGDAFRNMSYLTFGPKIALPFDGFSIDPAQVKESAKALLKLEPALVAFGHGSPVSGERLARGMSELGVS